ncbi:MAG: hypothetical protein ACLFNS_12590 [Desulfobacterales bacterium]
MKDSIETEAEYETALERIEVLMGAAPGSPEADELMRLAAMVEKYEDIHYPIDPPPEFENHG